MQRIVVTGAAGFIGSNFIRLLRRVRPEWEILAVDCLTYAGNLENLADFEGISGYGFAKADISDPDDMAELFATGVHAVVNFAAESHVDRSILGAHDFVRTNVAGVLALLDLSRRFGVGRFVQVSTDEVYGSLGASGRFTERTPISPNSPYSASKAAGDLLVQAYHHTFAVPTLITRCSNNYGPYQFPEKLIPLFITNLLDGKKVPLYGDGLNVRDWIHVDDHCTAILAVLEDGRCGEVYNIGGDCELPNLEIARRILSQLSRDESMIEYVKDRPGHDRRYAMDSSKMAAELGWRPRIAFDDGLPATVAWYIDNESWWRRIKSGDYLRYYEMQYGPLGMVGAASA